MTARGTRSRRTALVGMLLVAPVTAAAVALAVPVGTADVTPAGTTIGGLPAGGLDRDRASRLLRDTLAAQPSRLQLQVGARQLALSAADLGVEVDVTATVDEAWDGLERRWWEWREPAPAAVPVVLRVDRPALDAVVARLEATAEVREGHGGLRARDGRVFAVLPTPGQHADADQLRAALLGQLERLPWPSSVALPVTEEPAHLAAAEVSRLASVANRALATPPTLVSGQERVRLTAGELAKSLTLVAPSGSAPHSVRLDIAGGLQSTLVARVADQLTVDPREPRLRTAEVEPQLWTQGDASWSSRPAAVSVSRPGRAGRAVTPSSVLGALRAWLRSVPGTEIKVPGTGTDPDTSDAAAARVDGLLGTFTTPFQCCQPRVRNITVMAAALDGMLVAQGERFSLNRTIGPRTAKKGYVEAPFILDGELSTDIGGGVSQVATTMFNAAFFAGLQLDRHTAHSFYISRYPAGREATVNYPGIDLQWTNDTGGPVLIRTRVMRRSVTVALYGVHDKRTVRGLSGPREPVRGKDFRIRITREVEVPGRPVRTTRFTTVYNEPPEDH